MKELSENLRNRAGELGLSDAEVARRAGLSPRRYGHYVTGTNEPDFGTFVKICFALDATPNELLGVRRSAEGDLVSDGGVTGKERRELVEAINEASSRLSVDELRTLAKQVTALKRPRVSK